MSKPRLCNWCYRNPRGAFEPAELDSALIRPSDPT